MEFTVRVNYIHGWGNDGYYVFRPFRTREEAQEFIDVNAMVCRLPDVFVENLVNGEWIKEEVKR